MIDPHQVADRLTASLTGDPVHPGQWMDRNRWPGTP
jgi:hypothetical protein